MVGAACVAMMVLAAGPAEGDGRAIVERYLGADERRDPSAGALRQDALLSLEEMARAQDRSLIPHLVEGLTRMAPGRAALLDLLALYQPPPEDWRDILVGALTVPDRDVQTKAILKLRDLRDEADARVWAPAVGRLVLRPGVGAFAASALGFAGALAADQAPALVRMLASANESDRKAAAAALAKIGDRKQAAPLAVRESVAAAALPALLGVLREDASRDVRLEASRAIDALQVDPAVATAALAEAAARAEEHPTVRQSILIRLGNRGGEARAAEPILAAFLPRAGTQTDLVESALEKIRRGAVHHPTLGAELAAKDPDAERRAHSYLRAKGVAFERAQFVKALYTPDLQVIAAFLDAGFSADTPAGNSGPPLGIVVDNACAPTVRPTPDVVRESVELLLASGADVNRKDVVGITPLMTAAGSGCDPVVIRTLVKAGARLQDRDPNGFDAFEFGLIIAEDTVMELVRLGYRVPAARLAELRRTYAGNPAVLARLRKASVPR